jgi:hypothetical protein
VVPRLTHGLLRSGGSLLLEPQQLRDSALSLPEQLHGIQLRSLFSNGMTAPPQLSVHALLGDFPLAVLYSIDSA